MEEKLADKKYYYAVREGRVPGIYFTWEDCKNNVSGVKGAIYKKFKTLEEAEAFIFGKNLNKNADELKTQVAVAYVDGSYNVNTREYGSGVIMYYNNTCIKISEKGNDSELAKMRNVAGEILASELAMKTAYKIGAKNITIYHDYEGIAKWCLGQWMTNKEGTKAYKEY